VKGKVQKYGNNKRTIYTSQKGSVPEEKAAKKGKEREFKDK
jgi:hypothetical protein